MIDEIIDYKVNRKMEIFRNQYSILCSKLAILYIYHRSNSSKILCRVWCSKNVGNKGIEYLRTTVVKMNLITAVSCLILGTKLLNFASRKSNSRGRSISPCLLGEHERASGKSSVVSMVEYEPPASSSFPSHSSFPLLPTFPFALFRAHSRISLSPPPHRLRRCHLATKYNTRREITRTRRRLLH